MPQHRVGLVANKPHPRRNFEKRSFLLCVSAIDDPVSPRQITMHDALRNAPGTQRKLLCCYAQPHRFKPEDNMSEISQTVPRALKIQPGLCDISRP